MGDYHHVTDLGKVVDAVEVDGGDGDAVLDVLHALRLSDQLVVKQMDENIDRYR